MYTLVGKGTSPGLAKGTAYIYRDILQQGCAPYGIDATQVHAEQVRIHQALEDVRQRLTIDATHTEDKLGKESADIFRAQEMMLGSSSIVEELEETLQAERLNAEEVVRSVFRRWTHRFREMGDEVLRERGDDVDDLSRRLVSSLAGTHAHSLENLPANTVLVASRLLPSDTVFLSRNSTVAVLEECASPAAHATLLAGELGIPCVIGIPKLVETVHTGDIVLVDSIKETAVINPNARVLQTFEESLAAVRKRKKTTQGNCMNRAVTKDGIEMSVMANVRSREDVELALSGGADGIGMLRTEPFFLSTQHFPSDKEFASFLIDSLQPAQGKHIEVRLLDIGADKNPNYLHLPAEPDPFLGQRGVRLLLEYPDVLEAQLRAMLEVSKHFRIGVLIPMVTTESDVTRVVQRIRALANDMGICKLPRIGAMLETPAAALSIPSLRKHVDFFSIGSNDLTQYTMAAGRENPLVTEYFLDDHAAILRLIELAISESGDTPVSLCGELAGRTDAMPRLLATGVRSLSVPAPLVPEVKSAIRNINASAKASLLSAKFLF
jgi:phosphoenolpyruvate-protein phosphotransferase (PTS system enzyme I)